MANDFGFKASIGEDFYFVSYNTEDAERVGDICRILNQSNVPLWYDGGINHDTYWESVLAEQIDKCKEVIFFITKKIFEKGKNKKLNEIYTYKEYDLAKRYHKKTLIVFLDSIHNEDVPYSLMSWWQEIDPGVRQVILAEGLDPKEISDKILKEIGFNTQMVHHYNEELFSPTINSVCDNPSFGDERSFIHIRPIGDKEWYRDLVLESGQQYEIDIFFRNDSNPKYNSSEYNHKAVAVKSRVAIDLPRFISKSKKSKISVKLMYDSLSHVSLSCVDSISIELSGKEHDEIHYVSGSAQIFNHWKTNGTILSASLFSFEGTLIGLNSLDGVIPGGDDYSGCIRLFINVGKLKYDISE